MKVFFTIFIFMFVSVLGSAQDEAGFPKVRCISTLGLVVPTGNNANGNFKNSFPNPLSSISELPRYGKQFLDLLKNKWTRKLIIEETSGQPSLMDFLEHQFRINRDGTSEYNALVQICRTDPILKLSVPSLVPLYDQLLLNHALKLEIKEMPNPKMGFLIGFRHGPVNDLMTAIDKQTEFILQNPGKEVPSVESFIPEKHRNQTHEEYFNHAFSILQKMGNRVANGHSKSEPMTPRFSFWNNAPHPGLEFTAEEYQTEPLTPIFQNTAFAHGIKTLLELQRKSPDETWASLFTSEMVGAFDITTFKSEAKKIARVLKAESDSDPHHPLRRIMANALPKLVYLDRILELIPEHPLSKKTSKKVLNETFTMGASLSHLLFDLRNDWLSFEKRENLGVEPFLIRYPEATRESMGQILRETEERIARENPELVPIIPVEVAKSKIEAPVETRKTPHSPVMDLTAAEPIDTSELNLVQINQFGDSLIKAESDLSQAVSNFSDQVKMIDASTLYLREIDERLATLDELMKNTEHLMMILQESISNIEAPKKKLEKQTGKSGTKSRTTTALNVLSQKEKTLNASLAGTQNSFELAEQLFLKLSEIRGKQSSQMANAQDSTAPKRMRPKE